MAIYEWIAGQPVQTDNTNYEWVAGQPWIVYDSTAVSGYTLTCDSGAYTLTGGAVSVLLGREVAIAAGSYGLSGTAADGLHDKVIVLGSDSYTIVGSNVVLTYAQGGVFGDYHLFLLMKMT